MSGRSGWRRPVALAASLLVTAGILATGWSDAGHNAAAAADGSSDGRLELLLDSSGSMKEPAGGGQKKITAAKQALHAVVDDLPSKAQVGMRVYGATVFSKRDPGACRDSQQVVDIGAVDKGALHKEIDRYKPYGETPIAYSLKQAARDLGSEGKRTIVMVSDGEETCEPDPCKIARQIARTGIDLKIDVVGFRVRGQARNQLRCIADAGRGSYYDADDVEDLKASLGKLSTRAYRPFELTGEPVEGSENWQTAPEITPGQYTTTLDAANSEPEYLSVKKTPGSTLWMSITTRPPYDVAEKQTIALGAALSEDEACGSGRQYVEQRGTADAVVVAGMVIDPAVKRTAPCAESDHVVLAVGGKGISGSAAWPAELTVIEEPEVESRTGLPRAKGTYSPLHRSKWSGADDATKVVGGTSFSDAPTIGKGVYSDTILPGERLMYRVHVDFGQTLRSDVFVPRTDPATTNALPPASHYGGNNSVKVLPVFGRLFSPGRIDMVANQVNSVTDEEIPRTFANGVRGGAFSITPPQVRYQNREQARISFDGQLENGWLVGASQAGYYYLEVNALRDDNGQNYTIPFQLKIDVDGEPSGQPDYADLENSDDQAEPGAAPTYQESEKDSDSASASQSDDGSLLPVAATAGGIGVVVLVAIGLLLVLRRRRSEPPA